MISCDISSGSPAMMFTNSSWLGYRALTQDDNELEEKTSNQEDASPDDEETTTKSLEISTWRLVSNIINYMEGVGFLALPYAIHEGGITVLIGLAVVPFMMAYTAYILADCLDDEDDFGQRTRQRCTYQEIGMACWPPFKHIIWIFVTITVFITMCSLIILSATLISQQFRHVPITESQWACIGTVVVLPTVFLERLSQIAWVSLVSVIALVASAGITLGYEFQEVAHWDFHSLLFWDTRGVFVGLSILTLSYGIHTASVTMAAEVSKLSKFKVALVLAYLLGSSLKVLFGASGYLTYTNKTSEVILNNLPSGILVQVIATFFVLNVLLTYPIQVVVLVENIEELPVYENLTNKVSPKIRFVVLRIVIVLGTLAFSVGIPHFALILAFTGSLNYTLVIIFPALFHLCLKYKRLSALQISVDAILVILGTIGMVFGLTTTIISLDAVM